VGLFRGSDTTEIASNMVILRGQNKTRIDNSCGSPRANVTGHALIVFKNCSIQIGEFKFRNRVITSHTILQRPSVPGEVSTDRTLTFKDIILKNEDNLKKITELQFHKDINTAVSTTLVVVVALLLIFIYVLCKRQTKVKVRVDNGLGRLHRAKTGFNSISRKFKAQTPPADTQI